MSFAAIHAMWLRQIKRYWRSKSRLVGGIGQSVLFLLAFGFGFSPIFERAGAGNYINFLSPGIIAMSILFTSMYTGLELVWDRKFGFLKETLVAPISRATIVFGRTLGGATIGMAQGILVFIMTLILGFRPHEPMMLLFAFVFMFIIALMLTFLGTAIATRIQDMQAFPVIMNFVILPMFFLSGALFPLEGLPPAMDALTAINPLTYAVDGLRYSLTGESEFGMAQSVLSTLFFSGLMGVICIRLFERIEA